MSYLISYDQLFSKLLAGEPDLTCQTFSQEVLCKFHSFIISFAVNVVVFLQCVFRVCRVSFLHLFSMPTFLRKSPVYHGATYSRKTNHSNSNLEFPVCLTCMFLGCGRAQPDCCEATVLTTAPPCEFQAMRFAFSSLYSRDIQSVNELLM